MAQQIINIGAAPNDGTGDPLRTGFTKVNANFTELYAIPAPGLTFISTQTAAGVATLDFTAGIDSTYNKYLFEITNLVSVTNAVDLCVQVSTDAGVSWKSGASDYFWARDFISGAGGGTTGVTASAVDTQIHLTGATISNVSTNPHGGELRLYSPSLAKKNPMTWEMSGYDGTQINGFRGTGLYSSNTAVNGIRFLLTSGNIATMTAALFGMRKS